MGTGKYVLELFSYWMPRCGIETVHQGEPPAATPGMGRNLGRKIRNDALARKKRCKFNVSVEMPPGTTEPPLGTILFPVRSNSIAAKID